MLCIQLFLQPVLTSMALLCFEAIEQGSATCPSLPYFVVWQALWLFSFQVVALHFEPFVQQVLPPFLPQILVVDPVSSWGGFLATVSVAASGEGLNLSLTNGVCGVIASVVKLVGGGVCGG